MPNNREFRVRDGGPAEVYSIAADGEWATVVLRDLGSHTAHGHTSWAGEILIHSTFGTFGHYWGSMGESLRPFLIGLNFGYWAGKLAGNASRVFDREATWKSIRERVLEVRREGDLTHEEARSLYDDLVDEEEEHGGDDSHSFVEGVQSVARASDVGQAETILSEPWEYIRTKSDPQLVGLWEQLWKPFMEYLKTEPGDD